MNNKIMYEGELNLNGLIIPCYVLEDGTRVLSGRGLQESLKMVDDESDSTSQKSGNRLQRYLTQKSLQPYIYSDYNESHFEPMECYRGEQKVNGYEATVLVDICDAFLEARKNIKLSSRQEIIANQCEILVRSFAKVGITALVDEATGYQYDRERYELQKVLQAYIAEETLKWQLTFTDEFYKEVFRLWGIPFIPKYIKRKPQFIGNITTKYVYEILPDGVVEKIKEITPKSKNGNYKYRFHQSLTPEIGREHLKKQIIETTTLMSISSNKEEFQLLFNRKYNKFVQLSLDYDEELKKEEQFSKHNKSLEKVTDCNSSEQKFEQGDLF